MITQDELQRGGRESRQKLGYGFLCCPVPQKMEKRGNMNWK